MKKKTNIIGPINLYYWRLMLAVRRDLKDPNNTPETNDANRAVLKDCFDSFVHNREAA